MSYKEVGLEEILEVIGDDVGNKYSWFLIAVDAVGYDIDNKNIWEDKTWGGIWDKCSQDGHYEIEWSFFKKIAPKIRTVSEFIFYACKNEVECLKACHAAEVEKNGESHCALEFEIVDSEIWEIRGTDLVLVENLKKHFSFPEEKCFIL